MKINLKTTNELIAAARDGSQACRVCANHCRDEDDEAGYVLWERRADRIEKTIEDAMTEET